MVLCLLLGTFLDPKVLPHMFHWNKKGSKQTTVPCGWSFHRRMRVLYYCLAAAEQTKWEKWHSTFFKASIATTSYLTSSIDAWVCNVLCFENGLRLYISGWLTMPIQCNIGVFLLVSVALLTLRCREINLTTFYKLTNVADLPQMNVVLRHCN